MPHLLVMTPGLLFGGHSGKAAESHSYVTTLQPSRGKSETQSVQISLKCSVTETLL